MDRGQHAEALDCASPSPTPTPSPDPTPNPSSDAGTTPSPIPIGGATGNKVFVGYYQTWSDGWKANGADTALAHMPSYVNVVNLSFMGPNTNYTAGSMSIGGTGIGVPYDGPTLEDAISEVATTRSNARVSPTSAPAGNTIAIRHLDSRLGRATMKEDRGDGHARLMASISRLSQLSPTEHPAPIARVRGTLITSSLNALRSRGHIDAYMRKLPSEHHDAINLVIAGSWIPISLAVAHYGACDALGLPVADQVSIGIDVAARIHGTFLGTITKLATGAGVTPWVGFRQVDRLWMRIVEGGSTVMTEIGPKEARIDVTCAPLASIVYWRTAFRGIIQGGCELFSRKAYVRELTAQGTRDVMVYRAAWV